jgi:hypothetical protein
VDGKNEHTRAVHHSGAYRLKAQEIVFVTAVIVQRVCTDLQTLLFVLWATLAIHWVLHVVTQGIT